MEYPPTVNRDPELIKIKTNVEEIKEIIYKTEKHDYEKLIKFLKTLTDFY